MLLVDWIVVSGLPTPNAAREPSSDTPKSLTTLATSPSTRPRPCHHCVPVPPVAVVRTQSEMVKLSWIDRGIWTDWLVPLRLTARPLWPATNVGLPTSVPLKPLPLPSLALLSNAYDATRSLPPDGGTTSKMPASMYWP